MIYKLAVRIKIACVNLILLLEYLLRRRKPIENPHNKILFTDISDPNLERYFYLLLKFFELAGFQIRLKTNLWLLLNLRNYAEFIYNIDNLKLVFSTPQKYDLHLTDKAESVGEKGRTLIINTNYFSRTKEESALTLAYSMHPDIYNEDIQETFRKLRREEKNIRVFSGGNTGKAYVNSDIKGIFGKINRHEIILKLLEVFSVQNKITEIDTADDLKNLFSENHFELVVIKKPFLTIREWMNVLAKSSFFIAPPGVSMPFSHNIIEAMAVGAIPITQYPEFFNPPLEDMVNCLSFTNEQDFCEKVTAALNSDSNLIGKLRNNVIAYYDTYLEPKAAVSQIINRLPDIEKLYINAEHISVTRLKQDLFPGK